MSFRRLRQKKESHTLQAAERSNGHAFSRHRFLSLCCPAKNLSNGYAHSQIDVDAPARPREKPPVPLGPVNEHAKTESPLPTQQKVRSLIPPTAPVRRTGHSTIWKRRNSSSSNTIKSFTSSMQSRSGEGNVYLAPTLAPIPIEMLESICRFLLQKGLFSLMLCNSKCSAAAAQYLYMEVSLFPIPKCCFFNFGSSELRSFTGDCIRVCL
jgi:hypothetical protein